MVQPLTTEQIDDYLEAAGPSLAAVRTVLQQNQVLRELAASPSMLNILTPTYRDASIQALPTSGSAEEQQRQIFASYTDRMLSTNETNQRTNSQQMLSWLSWLARQMQQQGQTIFYVEQLQPSWLSRDRLIPMYELLAIRLPSILMGMLLNTALYKLFFGDSLTNLILCLFLGALLGGISSRGCKVCQPSGRARKTENPSWQSVLQRLGVGTFISTCIALAIGLHIESRFALCLGVFTFLLHILLRTSSPANASSALPQELSISLQRCLMRRIRIAGYNGLLAALLVGLSYGLSYGLATGLSYELSYGLAFGLAGGLLSMLLIGSSPDIQPVDRLVWSWKSLKKSLSLERHRDTALLGFLLITLGVGLSYGLNYGLSYGLIGGLSYWLLGGLFKGTSSEAEHRQQAIANQEIRCSLSNGFILGFVSAIIVGLISFSSIGLMIELSYGLSRGLSYELRYGLHNWLSIGLIMGLSIGWLAALLNGGLAYLRHYILRFLLWREGSIPWRFPQFLDEATHHMLLRKVGHGYMFINQPFLDYVASLDLLSS
ncbi:MAG TPA: hypothetical protein VGL94_00650 [Ktedonobacteraceae bacterium]|jgi:hypothetical protein